MTSLEQFSIVQGVSFPHCTIRSLRFHECSIKLRILTLQMNSAIQILCLGPQSIVIEDLKFFSTSPLLCCGEMERLEGSETKHLILSERRQYTLSKHDLLSPRNAAHVQPPTHHCPTYHCVPSALFPPQPPNDHRFHCTLRQSFDL